MNGLPKKISWFQLPHGRTSKSPEVVYSRPVKRQKSPVAISTHVEIAHRARFSYDDLLGYLIVRSGAAGNLVKQMLVRP
jgi:hypothetical protein